MAVSAQRPEMMSVAARMRAEFDHGFTVAATSAAAAPLTFLAIRIGGDPFALPLAGLLGIHVDRKIVPVPSTNPTLMGIAAFRGALTLVHDLRLLLGYPGSAQARWLALVAAAVPVGLAFDIFERQFTVAPDRVTGAVPDAAPVGTDVQKAASAPSAALTGLTSGLVHGLDGVRPVIDLPAVLSLIRSMGDRR